MAASTLSREAILALLAAAPPHIAELTAGLSETQLRTRPGPCRRSSGWRRGCGGR